MRVSGSTGEHRGSMPASAPFHLCLTLPCHASNLFSLRKIFLCCTCEEDSGEPSSKAQPCYSTAVAPGKPAQWPARTGAWTPQLGMSPLGCVQVKHQVMVCTSRWARCCWLCVPQLSAKAEKQRCSPTPCCGNTTPSNTVQRAHMKCEGRHNKSGIKRLIPA